MQSGTFFIALVVHFYIARNNIPFKSSLTGSGIEISVDLLNGKIWGWLEYANNRIHSTSK